MTRPGRVKSSSHPLHPPLSGAILGPLMTSSSMTSDDSRQSSIYALALAALGIVYGDIGTSPLYAMRECFFGPHAVALNDNNVLGVLSLITWALLLVISVKYMSFVLRADNRGEGGILALMALASPRLKRRAIIFVGLFGAALLYGDGVITPAISILSAIEGLKVATPFFEPFVLPLTIVILVTLFLVQKHGTGKIGAVFGPIILLWFVIIGALGVISVIETPEIMIALNPLYAIDFFVNNHELAFGALGAIFLVMTGAEALYADMGHVGREPIRKAWFFVALPGLLFNYYGQGALLLRQPEFASNPFYYLAPNWFLYPLVGLATIAAVIASQALISGVFSITRQAIQLGYCPRLQVIHTSSREIGQIYLPNVNWGLLAATIWLVLTFKSSSNLAAAYGISVSLTMVITTLLMYVVTRNFWRWGRLAAFSICAIFLLVDLTFFAANVVKIHQGGWFPLAVGLGIFILMTTWRKGRLILADRLRTLTPPIDDFIVSLKSQNLPRVPGISIFMVGDPKTCPPALVHNVKHNKILHEKVVILTVLTKEVPHVKLEDRVDVQQLGDGFYRVRAHYGFMSSPDMSEILKCCKAKGFEFDFNQITFFLGRETLIASPRPGMAIWREHLFSFMSKNSQRATQFFNIPPDQVIEVGIQVEL